MYCLCKLNLNLDKKRNDFVKLIEHYSDKCSFIIKSRDLS